MSGPDEPSLITSKQILQLKVSLVGASKPPIWRRLLVPATMRLNRLHDVIQVAMGWDDYHLHAFEAAGVDYGLPDLELGHRDERKTSVGELLSGPSDRMRYIYDFGDHWQHDVVVEKLLATDPGGRYPVCLAGKGRCPPEDCGGVWGYADLRDTLANAAHPEHADMLESLGIESAEEFDPHVFDPVEVNLVLGGQARAA